MKIRSFITGPIIAGPIIAGSIMLLSLATFSQPGNFYKHMEGHIDNKLFLVVDLVSINNQVSGTYYYYYYEEEGDSAAMYYGKTIPIKGSLSDGNHIEFREFHMDSNGAVYQGQFVDEHRITGSWKNAEGSRVLPFELTETYDGGTMAFEVYHLLDSVPLVAAYDPPVATLDMTLLLPLPFEFTEVSDSVSNLVTRNFFRKGIMEGTPMEMLDLEKKQYFNNYLKTNSDIYEKGAASFNWQKVKSINIHYNQKYLLSVECFDYGYTGGAHGMPVSKFCVIDLTSGTRITLENIFRAEFENDLADIVNAALREKYELEPGTSLKEADFFVHDVIPCQNFFVNKDGLEFYYNRYEVAPFSMGSINVFIPFAKLKFLMKKDGPLSTLVRE